MPTAASCRRALPPEVRDEVEGWLRWYRDAEASLREADEAEQDILAPQIARWSHVNAQRGRPGDPTFGRAVKLSELRRQTRRARFVVGRVRVFLAELDVTDRLLLQMRYATEREARVASILECAQAMHVSPRTVDRRIAELLQRVAVRLRLVPPPVPPSRSRPA